ncbi:MAG: sn-glycerol-3-phosphate ABC transporter substrate-binding protein UgpB [Magnetococcales bacterium]|nr:sn-glycerol-3-phosphate ABC transporter substrate-binding protein UgpB [Magnetococcales bacterium]
MLKKRFIIVTMFFWIIALPLSAHATEDIQWWHAMGGKLGEKVVELANGFNSSQSHYRVVPVYKGNYTETMTAGIAAFRSKRPPHILQVFEVGTATMMAARKAIRPIAEVMADAGEPFDAKQYIASISGYYTSKNGEMLSLPFNSSTPVLYYNKKAFKKAGLDPAKPPKTWQQVEVFAKKLIASGYECGFSSAWISWIHLENMSAWHNRAFATKANGFEGFDTRLLINGELGVKHLSKLKAWQDEKIFVYGGRRNLGNSKFISEICPMYTESSAGYAGFKAAADFDFGISELPYWSDVVETPQNTIIGGASLWVMAGHKNSEYKGVAKFLNYLSSPAIQADWHQSTGYLPITKNAYELTKSSGYYKKNPDMEVALQQMTRVEPSKNSRGLRFGNMVRIRDVIYNEIEGVLAGKRTVKKGLNNIVKNGNKLLRKFERINKSRSRK